ncbi:MAG: hypothetical protein QOH13_843, partial [Thermoleophilaceae bacterium]|nr:hypothetical protein [Thermoleophilaceae bacterium]
MRRALDHALAAPGLTRGRFIALAVVSLLATGTVLASALRADTTPYDLIAAAHSARAPIVEVARRPSAPAPAPADTGATAPADPAPSDTPAPAADNLVAPAAPQVATPVSATPPAPSPVTPEPAPAKPISKVRHVFVISLAGAGYDATWGEGSSATYLNGTLRPQGALLEGYHPLKEGDLATQIALAGGQKATTQISAGCPTYGTGCVFPVETLSLPDQFVSSGRSWRAYVEDTSNGPDAAK